MYHWLSNVLKEEYSFVKCLKKSEESQVLVYRNKSTQTNIIVRHITSGIDIYEKLLTIKSEYLPQIYEVARGEHEALVLEEYIPGISVGEVLKSGLYTEEGTIKIIKGICDGLTVIHSHNIIHRDIKPDNVMITDSGNVKIIDFNASKEYKVEEEKDTKVLGTTGFAAPEQYGISQSDVRTDIYAIGVLINVMLTGEHPSKVMCNGKMKKIVKKAMSINPLDRYQNCEELKNAL